MNLKRIVIIICIIWTAIVAFWVIRSEYVCIVGKEVLLKTVPFDPRDLLMGDYVTLNYEISRVPKKYYDEMYSSNKKVYVVLKTDENNIATIENIQTKRPTESLYLKGKISRSNTIEYGIESYYVKEHTARELEKNLRNRALVKVCIDKYGNAKVKGFVENNI